jgi:hypothetical protein
LGKWTERSNHGLGQNPAGRAGKGILEAEFNLDGILILDGVTREFLFTFLAMIRRQVAGKFCSSCAGKSFSV